MKGLLILTISCITLALCRGDCFLSQPEVVMKDGKFVVPDGCIDPFDKSKHELGSEWNTAKCYSCSCDSTGETQCCSRYGGMAVMEGCTAVADPETCTLKFYDANDPTKPCPKF